MAVSILLLPYQDAGQPEEIVNRLNLIIGMVMIVSALIYLRRSKTKTDSAADSYNTTKDHT